MSYIELTDLQAAIPADFLTGALDDDTDGVLESWPAVQAAACRAVDALIGGRFSVPVPAPCPAAVVEAAFAFAAEMIYNRRGVHGKDNPYAERARAARELLARIGAGELPLDPALGRAKPSVSLITEPSRTSGDRISV